MSDKESEPAATPGSPDDDSNSQPRTAQEASGPVESAPRPYSPRVDGASEGK